MTRDQVYEEIRRTLGLVPSFLKAIPDSSLEWEWRAMKAVQLDDGPIPHKYRELTGVAIAGATKCKYCSFFHTEFAGLHGATTAEIEHAVHYAKSGAGWSTYLYGLQFDMDEFKREIKKATEFMGSGRSQPPSPSRPASRSRAQVFDEVGKLFGFVPTFIKALPDSSLAAEWDAFVNVEVLEGPIPAKYLALAGVGVSAATKCSYCIHAETEMAKLAGATAAEIEAAVHYAKATAGWSTYINGLQLNFDEFKGEVRAIVEYAKKNH
jgi:AhpD family alkylhydroperoxidase